MSSLLQKLQKGPLSTAIVGCGNWASAIGMLAAANTAGSHLFEENVYMYVRPNTPVPGDDQENEGVSCTADYINKFHVNKTFLPGYDLPKNLIATTSYKEISKCDMVIFVIPHQFVRSTCKEIKLAGGLKEGAQALTLVKGIDVKGDQVELFSDIISNELGVQCCALSGANVAKDIANSEFSETTIGYHEKNISAAQAWQLLLDRPNFKIDLISDVSGVQLCGALKNLVAVAAGFSDGMGYGTNTKSALIRLGVREMKRFSDILFPDATEAVYFESAGFADVITTCFGGRNVRCAAEFIRRGGNRGECTWADVEADILGNQKMQGQLTCNEVYGVLQVRGLLDQFPLFEAVYKVAFEQFDSEHMLNVFRTTAIREFK